MKAATARSSRAAYADLLYPLYKDKEPTSAFAGALRQVRLGFETLYSEEQLRLIIDAIPTLVWSARTNGAAEFVNRRWLDYTGLSAEQAREWGWTVAVHPNDLNRLVSYWKSLLNSGEPGEIEARLRCYDGEFRWFLFRGSLCVINQAKLFNGMEQIRLSSTANAPKMRFARANNSFDSSSITCRA